MQIFKTKVFRRFQRKEGINDAALCAAIERAESGLIDADLGHGLIKQRVAREGSGRRGGFRTVIAYRLAPAPFLFSDLPRAGVTISQATISGIWPTTVPCS